MLIQGNATHIPMKDKSVQLCAFSPPYWGLRKYSVKPLIWGDSECLHEWGIEYTGTRRGGPTDTLSSKQRSNTGASDTAGDDSISQGQFCQLCGAWRGDLGLEPTPELYLDHMMLVTGECWRVLRDDGVCFVNIGDSYTSTAQGTVNAPQYKGSRAYAEQWANYRPFTGCKPKSLVLIPQKFAIRCQEAGWIIRSEIIWAKPNPMPESVKDRPTRSHEQVWLMTKQGRYYWDQDAVKETAIRPGDIQTFGGQKALKDDIIAEDPRYRAGSEQWGRTIQSGLNGRNIRDVWFVATEPTPEAHFATWPTELCEKMIRAATKPGDIVLDPLCGTAKTVLEAERLNRIGVGMDLSWEYLSDIAAPRRARPLQRELYVSKP